MRTYLTLILAALFASACGGDKQEPAATSATPAARPAAVGAPPGSAGTEGSTGSGGSAPAATANAGLAGRTRELVNPDNNTMVFLYFDLAGIAPPIDSWVEKDNRVQYAQPVDKAPLRTTVKAELESGAAAVRGVGTIRLSLNSANLSAYDPTYGEFMVGALAPSSVVSFDALGQKVSLRFGNGRTAQIWRVPAAEAQAIRDKIGYSGVALDTLLRITGVQPGPGGGTIVADFVEYEMRTVQSGAMIGRVQVAGQ